MVGLMEKRPGALSESHTISPLGVIHKLRSLYFKLKLARFLSHFITMLWIPF